MKKIIFFLIVFFFTFPAFGQKNDVEMCLNRYLKERNLYSGWNTRRKILLDYSITTLDPKLVKNDLQQFYDIIISHRILRLTSLSNIGGHIGAKLTKETELGVITSELKQHISGVMPIYTCDNFDQIYEIGKIYLWSIQYETLAKSIILKKTKKIAIDKIINSRYDNFLKDENYLNSHIESTIISYVMDGDDKLKFFVSFGVASQKEKFSETISLFRAAINMDSTISDTITTISKYSKSPEMESFMEFFEEKINSKKSYLERHSNPNTELEIFNDLEFRKESRFSNSENCTIQKKNINYQKEIDRIFQKYKHLQIIKRWEGELILPNRKKESFIGTVIISGCIKL